MSLALSTASTTSTSPARPIRNTRRLASHHRLMLWLVSNAGGLASGASWLSNYGIALAALAVATVVRMLLDPILEDRAAYGFYLIAVLFVVWRAGFGPALATVGCGILLGRFFFDTPRGSLAFNTESSQASLALSLTIGTLSAFLCESLRVTARDNVRLYQLARQADARKDEFLATLAHELRNPLLPIRNAIYQLDSIEDQAPRAVELHHVISRHTQHLIRLVNDLLDISRITQGKTALQYERVPLQVVVDGAIEVVCPSIGEKNQALQVSLPPGNVCLHADGVRLTQVLTNLLHNASKYTGREGRIWLSARVDANELFLRVRDTGIGIPHDMCVRIFDLFEQVHPAPEQSPGGLGIGLTLVRSLVQLHGGTVEAKSPGRGLGSEFRVRLPVIVDADDRPEEPPIAPASVPDASGGATLRVLVVDDSPAVALSLQSTIELWCHVVETSPDGFSALEAVHTFKPDVILVDLGMPKMNGYQLAEELRRMPELRDVPLIAVSGYGQEEDQQRSLAAGFARHLVKPIDPVELKQLLSTCASRN